MFLRLSHGMNRVGLSWLIALVRMLLFKVLRANVYEEEYTYPEKVGYRSWLKHLKLGVLAFRRLDGTIQYRW